jgi:neprilysin
MVIPDNQNSISSFSLIQNKLNEQLRTIIIEPVKDDEIEPFKNVKRLYRACTNTDLIESRGIEPVKRVIDSMGGWPLVDGDSWDKGNNWTWQNAVKAASAKGYPVHYLFEFSVKVDDQNTSRRTISVSENFLEKSDGIF